MSRTIVLGFLVTLLAACGSSATETATPEPSEDVSPPATESSTGQVVGEPVRVETFIAHPTNRGSVVLIASGFVPSSCHEAQLSVEEPDANGVMVVTSEAWLDPECQVGEEAPFMLSLQYPGLAPDQYTAVLDGRAEVLFSIEDVDGLESALPGVPDDLIGSWRLDAGFDQITGLPRGVEVLMTVRDLQQDAAPLQVELAFGCGDIGGSTSGIDPLLVTEVTLEGVGCDADLAERQNPVAALVLVALPTARIENGKLDIQTTEGVVTFSR